MTFASIGLSPPLLKAAEKLGFTEPMPIQAEVLPILLSESTDLIGLAQTGTGKTGAFGFAVLQNLDLSQKHTQCVVLCPTRELCLQITKDLQDYGLYLEGLNVVPVYGGAPIIQQITRIKKAAQVIVATPGRLLDLIRRKVVKLERVSYAVLDEADEMLNMGFQEDLDAILATLPKERNIWLFSATMPKGVARIAEKYLSSPREITVGTSNATAANITHYHCTVHEKHRYQALKRVMDFYPRMYGLIFCRTRKETQQVAESLLQDGYVTEALHGDLTQSQRDTVMRKFRSRGVNVLVATDVAARGLDVDDITHVLHYRLPENSEIYTHRSGRTARAGKSGISITLLNLKEFPKIRFLERSGIAMESMKIPSDRAICEKQLFYMVEKIVKTEINREEIDGYLPAVYEALGGFDKEELIQRFVSAEFSRFLDYYRHSADINVPDRKSKSRERPDRGERPERRERSERPHNKVDNAQRLFINVGKMDNIGAGAIVRLVCENAEIPAHRIGGIKLNRDYSYFEVDGDIAEHVKRSLKNTQLDGRPVKISMDGEKKERSSGGGSFKDKKKFKKKKFKGNKKDKGKPASKKSYHPS